MLKLFWFTIDSPVLLNEEVQFCFHDICNFVSVCWLCKIIQKDYMKGSLNISANLSILVETNLVRTFLVIIFLILIMVCTLENNYFLMLN